MFPRFPSLPVSRRHLLRLAGRLLSERWFPSCLPFHLLLHSIPPVRLALEAGV
jgi:hypothetical protein